MITKLRRPFIIRLNRANIIKRVVAIEQWPHSTFLLTDDAGAINHRFALAMFRSGEAMFDVEKMKENEKDYLAIPTQL